MRNQKALRPMRSGEAGGRFWGGSVEGPKCSETLLSNMRSEAARSLGVQPLRGTQASCRILCVAGHARACTELHATMQHVRVIGVGLSRRSQSEPTRAAFAALPSEGARAGHCRGRPTRNSGNNRTEGKDERAGNTWRDVVTREGAQGRCGRKRRSRRARASGKWRGRHARVASRVRPPRAHGRHIPLHVPILWGCRQQHCAFWPSRFVDHRRHCGNRFQVKDGCVVTKKMVYQCPFCDGKVSSNLMTGQVDHRNVCGSRFYVKTSKVSDATRKHMHICPRCQAAVWSACASGRIRVQHNTPAGRPCTQKSWMSEEKKEA